MFQQSFAVSGKEFRSRQSVGRWAGMGFGPALPTHKRTGENGTTFLGDSPKCDERRPYDSARLTTFTDWGLPMERDWKEEQRQVLARLFETAFGRREASDDEIRSDIHKLGTVNKQLEKDD